MIEKRYACSQCPARGLMNASGFRRDADCLSKVEIAAEGLQIYCVAELCFVSIEPLVGTNAQTEAVSHDACHMLSPCHSNAHLRCCTFPT